MYIVIRNISLILIYRTATVETMLSGNSVKTGGWIHEKLKEEQNLYQKQVLVNINVKKFWKVFCGSTGSCATSHKLPRVISCESSSYGFED